MMLTRPIEVIQVESEKRNSAAFKNDFCPSDVASLKPTIISLAAPGAISMREERGMIMDWRMQRASPMTIQCQSLVAALAT